LRLSLSGTSQRRVLALVPVVLVAFISILAYGRARSVVADVQEVERSHQVLEESSGMLTRAIDAETGQRAFLLTGDVGFLEPYKGARADIDRSLAMLRQLVEGDPAQMRRLRNIERVVDERFGMLDSAIALRAAGRLDAASSAASQLSGKQKMDQLRVAVASLQAHEQAVLAERRDAEQRGVRNAAAVVVAAALIALLIGALINIGFARALEKGNTANTALRQLNEDLERQSAQLETQAAEMESQAAELEATADDLKATNDELTRTTRAAELSRDAAENARHQLEGVLESRKREQQGALLLSEASRVLASTLDYEKTLEAVARLAVGHLADWCGVDLIGADGKIRQVVVAHLDVEKIKWAKELNKRYPTDYGAPTGVGHVISTGQPEIYPEISDEMLVAGSRDPDHLAIMRELQIKSALIVPMIARGRTLGALTFISTEKGKQYAQADLELAMELATRAAIAIDNAQLYRSALAASEAKSTFLATMSHELRTPLNAIIGYQSLLKEGIGGPVNDTQFAQLTRIRASADHLLGLIDEVLTFSRVEAGKEVVSRSAVHLKPIIDEAVTMVIPLAELKGIELQVEAEDAMLFTDGGKIRQILLNLLSNAVKFTDEGEIRVRTSSTGESVVISITDTGIGIAPENQERIFDPFWQVQQRSTRRAGGTGLGLSVSRTLARLIGGEISVESNLEKGSTFTLSLPTRRA
jgi:signal transduction histidine kinase/CHASE3 domain sensor protein